MQYVSTVRKTIKCFKSSSKSNTKKRYKTLWKKTKSNAKNSSPDLFLQHNGLLRIPPKTVFPTLVTLMLARFCILGLEVLEEFLFQTIVMFTSRRSWSAATTLLVPQKQLYLVKQIYLAEIKSSVKSYMKRSEADWKSVFPTSFLFLFWHAAK